MANRRIAYPVAGIVVILIIIGAFAYYWTFIESTTAMRPTVNVTLYEGELNATRYGFGNTSSSLTSPGPTLHFRVGDVVNVTVYNVGSLPHAWALTDAPQYNAQVLFNAHVGSGDVPLAPGQHGNDIFQVAKAGNFYYVCSVSGHTEQGMYGSVVVSS